MKNYGSNEILEHTSPKEDSVSSKRNTITYSKSTPKDSVSDDDSASLGKKFSIFIVLVLCILVFVLGVLMGRYITKKQYSDVKTDAQKTAQEEIPDVIFTKINTDDSYEMKFGDAIQLPCHVDNAVNNIKIEYIFQDKTMGQTLYSEVVNAGYTCKFVPSNYFSGERTISIIQNAYSTSDDVGANVLATNYSEIELSVLTEN